MARLLEVFAVFCFGVILLVSGVTAAISCKSDDNKDVPWFFMYKLPEGAKNERFNTFYDGEDYLYVSPNTWRSKSYWRVSPKKITDKSSALFRTISYLTTHGQKKNFHYAIYNDQVNGMSPDGYGHTKGILMYDHEDIVWIIHSVPSFPNITKGNEYDYPETGTKNGQTVFCVTFPSDYLKKIVADVWYQHPYFYGPSKGKGNGRSYLQEVFESQIIPNDGQVRRTRLTDYDRNKYISFAKPSNYEEDVYSGVIAPELHSHLLVSTWRNGLGRQVPHHFNNSLFVVNIGSLTFNLGEQESVVVKNTADHSKWAITLLRHGYPYVCIGTLNRMFPQYRRGGETLCVNNEWLYRLLCTSLASEEECFPKWLDMTEE